MNSPSTRRFSLRAIRCLLIGIFLLPLGILSAAPVHEVLASFGSNAFYPSSGNLVLGPDDYFWGTTQSGGAFGGGVIYKVKADGSDWQAVVDFSGNGATNKGSNPQAGLYFDNINTFWGSTTFGGASNYGTIFKLNATTGVLTTLVEFTSNGASEKGAYPYGKLARDSSGYFWGTTRSGGASNLGTIFRIHIQSGSLTTAIEFTGNGASNKGSSPLSGFTSDFAGNFWGTTEAGGATGNGTIYKINLSSGILTTVVEFTGNGVTNKGRDPVTDLNMDGENFWGTTVYGGATDNGTIFKLNRSTGVLTTVIEFTGNGASNKGRSPHAALRSDGAGNFWGTTKFGGATDRGTIFKLNSTTSALTTVIDFTGNGATNKGQYPIAGFSTDSAANLWSSTAQGGASDRGTLFKLNPTTGVLTTVVEFPGGSFTKGKSPAAGLTPDSSGNLWGSTPEGGANGLGTLFKITAPLGSLTSSVLTTVIEFTGNGASNKGASPQATLRPDGAGNLWGTTRTGGANGLGTVFKVNTTTGILTTVVEFTGNAAANKGSQPLSELLDDGSGFFWGTTSAGGAGDHGTLFKINASLGQLSTMVEFTGTGGPAAGRTPCGGLIADGSGYLWGTTASGGAGGFGTLYKIQATTGTFTSLVEFSGNGASNKGAAPRSRLVQDGAGNLWGTTEDGALGYGTVFKINIATGQLTTVTQFTGNGSTNRGAHPLATLTADSGGRFWGTTRGGGAGDHGTVFSIQISTGTLTTELEFTGNGTQANSGSSPGPGALYFHSDGRLYGCTSDGGPLNDGTLFRLHINATPEIVVNGANGTLLTDNIGSTEIGPVRLRSPFVSTITISNDGYLPLTLANLTISRDGQSPVPLTLRDVTAYNRRNEVRWSQNGELPPSLSQGERAYVDFEIPPSQPGQHSFTISISSNDADESPFEIHLTALFVFQKDLIVSGNGSIMRFDGSTGAPKGFFIIPGTGGLSVPTKMVLGPDGKIYIADMGTQTIKRFDLEGNFVDNFVPQGYITNPVALNFGPDGKLYTLCCGTIRQIHRFNGTTGAYEGIVVNASSTQVNNSKDFIFMPGTNDFLIVSGLNSVARFNFTTGAFISQFLNSTKSTSILNNPTSIIIGPDGNYWVTSSNGTNKITRFSITNGATIDNAFIGPNITGGHQEMVFLDGFLYVANGSGNNIGVYDAYSYVSSQVPPQPVDGGSFGGDGLGFVAAGSQGLSNPRNILFLTFNDPPVTYAGADQSSAPGQVVTLTATSSDPEGLPFTYQWTQLSGTPVLSGSLLASGDVNSASLGFITPDSGGPLVFQLTVSDGVKSATDTVVVTISGPAVGVVPALTLQAADGLTTQSATLHGTVNPVAGSAVCSFEYGPVSLNTWTAVQTVSSAQAVNATLTGLQPGQTYFYRLIATNGVGGQFTTERSFTTLFEQREIVVESPPAPELTDGSGELDVGKVIYGRSGIARIITIRNGGATDLLLGPITKDGTEPADFAVSTPATTVLSAGSSVNFTVIFTPGALGVRTAAIHIASNDADEAAFDIALTGTGVTPPESWRFQNFGIITNTGNAADSFDPDHDSLVNLLERAFNLNPNQPALPIVTAGTGTTGLPLIRRTGQPPVFSIQYLRRKASANSGLTYTPQFCSSLTDSGPAGWATATGTETVQSIDTEWELVTVEEDAGGQQKRFGRVKVVSGE